MELSSLLFGAEASVPPPLMVARKADTSSLRYGYVAFKDEEQRDAFVEERDGEALGEGADTFRLEASEFGGKGPKEAKVREE